MKIDKDQLAKISKEHRLSLLVVAFVLVGLLTAWASSPSKAETPQAAPMELSTFIPRGYLLIPIELKNADQLDGILGTHGIVDLFEASDLPGVHSKLVGRRLRLVRAPMNPRAFAILVKEAEAERILGFQGPFIASVRAKDAAEHELVPKTRGPQIEFQTEVK